MTYPEMFLSIAVIAAVFLIVATAVLLWRAPDALSRVNSLGPVVGLALPLLIIINLVHDWMTDGFDLNNFIRAIIAIAALWIIGSVGSFYMGRSIYAVTVEDPRHGVEHKDDSDHEQA